jgi:hypothetical protein
VKDTPRHHRARVARATQLGNPAAIAAARADLRAAKARKYIEELVLAAPPLTAEQRDKLAVILRAGHIADEQPLDAA